MSDLREFLSEMAVSPTKLGEFLLDPDGTMEDAGLSADDRASLRAGVPGMIVAALFVLTVEEPQRGSAEREQRDKETHRHEMHLAAKFLQLGRVPAPLRQLQAEVEYRVLGER